MVGHAAPAAAGGTPLSDADSEAGGAGGVLPTATGREGQQLLNRTLLSPTQSRAGGGAFQSDHQRKRARPGSSEPGTPGYAELGHEPLAPRRKRLLAWCRTKCVYINRSLGQYRKWVVVLCAFFSLLVILLCLAYQLGYSSFSADLNNYPKPPSLRSFGRLRGGKSEQLFSEYDVRRKAIDEQIVNERPIVIYRKTNLSRRGENLTGDTSAAAEAAEPFEAVPLRITERANNQVAKSVKRVRTTLPPPPAMVPPIPGADRAERPPPPRETQEKAVVPAVVPPPAEGAVNVVPASKTERRFTLDEEFHLNWRFLEGEKDLPYTGDRQRFAKLFPKETFPYDRTESEVAAMNKTYPTITARGLPDIYYNLLAVFPGVAPTRRHGRLGVTPDGKLVYTPKPMPVPAEEVPGGLDVALKKGGFYLPLSDALPLDRDTLDSREDMCKAIPYDPFELDDASVVITYYNEPFSTLLRSVHSVLNQTPPELLREIILVDDHSVEGGCHVGSGIEEYVRLLPKVKLMHLGERRGIVTARLAGMKLATAPVVVVLDSHIEVNEGWLEPQLARLKESPRSVVFPQILSINPTNFDYLTASGIGTYLSFKWMMQERPYAPHAVVDPAPVMSPSMAGGLFAVKRDWFWQVGAFDEEFEMWGAENVEFALRVWQCGGRVEGIPCSKTYHIYRMKGSGYTSPSEALLKNRLRTARLWLDDYYQVASKFIVQHPEEHDTGSFDKILALKDRLKCKNFSWFMENIASTKQPRSLDDVELLGEIKSRGFERYCLDNLQGTDGDPLGIYPCHGMGGSQGFMTFKNNPHLMLGGDETHCVAPDLKQRSNCEDVSAASDWRWELDYADGFVRLHHKDTSPDCLAIEKAENNQFKLALQPCDSSVNGQRWQFAKFQPDPYFELPTYSPARKAFNERRERWNSGQALEQ